MIVDEAHNLKTHDGMYAKTFIEYAKYCSKVLLLSGTFVLNKPNDIINAIAMIDGKDPVSEDYFDKHIMTDEELFYEYFKCKISYFECDRKEGYPEEVNHIQEFEMDKGYYKKYHEIEKKWQCRWNKMLCNRKCYIYIDLYKSYIYEGYEDNVV